MNQDEARLEFFEAVAKVALKIRVRERNLIEAAGDAYAAAAEATLRAECERLDQQVEEQRQLLNTAVVKLDSCYRDYKKYRKQSEHKDARIAQLKAAVHGRQLVIDGLNDIIAESAGVAGWHLSGDVADWETFEFVALASNYAAAALKETPNDKG